MRFLVDEDLDTAVGGFLTLRGHDALPVVQALGSGAKDPVIRQFMRASIRAGAHRTLITADIEFARRCAQEGSRLPCLWLRDLGAHEYDRVAELVPDIEREMGLLGPRFFMEIRARAYLVRR